VGYLGAAFVLCSPIGLEREVRRKSAKLRTHALVGLGSALFVHVSSTGSRRGRGSDRPGSVPGARPDRVRLGFLGAGSIFVRRDSVRGLTTAAVAWLTAAVGAACGSGLWPRAQVLRPIVTSAFGSRSDGTEPGKTRLGKGYAGFVSDSDDRESVSLSPLTRVEALRALLAVSPEDEPLPEDVAWLRNYRGLGLEDAKARAVAEGRPLRVIRPGSALHADFKAHRLNLYLDADGNLTEIHAG
jgi:hypothetical protein